MYIVDRSLTLAHKLFPQSYNNRERYRTFHFCFAWDKNKLVSIGQNDPHKESAKALKMAKITNNKNRLKYPFLCAEIDCLSKMYGKIYIGAHIKLVVLRLNSRGELKNTKPCKSCQEVLDAFGVSEVYFSDGSGEITWH